ncbi:MAG: hypothetical protein HYY40_14030 [Bacteroidetes bacterium]|nr:hypothetical protein [Bacteroidota bacterium]
MAKIIRQDFTVEDFNKLVQEFLYTDIRVTLPKESLLSLQEHLVKAGPSFQKIFAAYFSRQDNTRYDDLTAKMVSFVKKLLKYNADLQGEERKVFILFWNEIAEMIKADCVLLQNNYLTNSCNYFVWEIGKLA